MNEYSNYEQLKSEWIASHPETTAIEIEDALVKLADELEL